VIHQLPRRVPKYPACGLVTLYNRANVVCLPRYEYTCLAISLHICGVKTARVPLHEVGFACSCLFGTSHELIPSLFIVEDLSQIPRVGLHYLGLVGVQFLQLIPKLLD
jgi:hypothetical protein